MNMKKILPILIPVVLLAIVAIVLFLNVSSNQKNSSTQIPSTSTPAANITPFPMTLAFTPPIIKLTSNEENKVESDVTLDVGPQDIRSVRIVLLCDPKRVKNLTVTQKRDRYSALSYAFADSQAVINNETCEATLDLQIPAQNPEQRGSGIVAHVTATVIGSAPTEIVILPQSVGSTDNSQYRFETQRVNLELN